MADQTKQEQPFSLSLRQSASILGRAWKLTQPWKFQFWFGFLLGCTSPFYYSLVVSYIIREFTVICTNGSFADFPLTLLRISLLVAFGLIVYPLCFGMIYVTYSRVSGAVRKQIFQHAESLEIAYVESHYSGDMVARITSDFGHAMQLVAYPVVGQGNPFALVFTVLTIGSVILITHPLLGSISIVLGVLNLLVVNSMVKPLQQKEKRVKEATAQASQEIVNSLSGTVVSRIFGLDSFLRSQYEAKTQAIYQENYSLIRKKSLLFALSDLQSFISFAGVTIIGLYFSSLGLIDIPSVVFISTLQMSLSEVIAELGRKFADMQKYLIGAMRMFEFLDSAVEQERPSQAEANTQGEIALEIRALDFQYPQTQKPVFSALSLKVHTGERLAIVGGSGGGKSTLFKLLLDFAQEDTGIIHVFGNSKQQYSRKQLRSLFSYVPQDCYLFDTSILENVRMGKPKASIDEVWQALSDADIADFVRSLPIGIDTRTGERGAKLSGGQRQRMAIARAFLKNAPILLLDEATSALDSQSEQEVQKALRHLMQGRTSLVIAHRLSTIQDMDRILVFERGQIVEEGSHNDLMHQNRRYAELFAMQFH